MALIEPHARSLSPLVTREGCTSFWLQKTCDLPDSQAPREHLEARAACPQEPGLPSEGSQLPILFKDQVDTKTAHAAGLTARLGVFVIWMLKTLKEIPGKKLCLQGLATSAVTWSRCSSVGLITPAPWG